MGEGVGPGKGRVQLLPDHAAGAVEEALGERGTRGRGPEYDYPPPAGDHFADHHAAARATHLEGGARSNGRFLGGLRGAMQCERSRHKTMRLPGLHYSAASG